MATVALKAELYDRIQQAAADRQADIDEMFNHAVRRYLWDLDRRKISDESKIYQQRHFKLKQQYLGQYIAMHKGQVVDHDRDFAILRERIHKKFQYTPVMITLVEEMPEQTFTRHGFRLAGT